MSVARDLRRSAIRKLRCSGSDVASTRRRRPTPSVPLPASHLPEIQYQTQLLELLVGQLCPADWEMAPKSIIGMGLHLTILWSSAGPPENTRSSQSADRSGWGGKTRLDHGHRHEGDHRSRSPLKMRLAERSNEPVTTAKYLLRHPGGEPQIALMGDSVPEPKNELL